MNLMLVDDDEICLFITKIVLQKHELNFNIISYVSPSDALENLKSQTDFDSLPDLILLDLNMPWLNGFDFLEVLQTNDKLYKHLNICILSSSDSSIDKSKALNFSSVIGYLEKPISLENLNDILTKIKKIQNIEINEKLNVQ